MATEISEPPTLEMIFNRSFEAIWYQSEVLHKREMDLLNEKFQKMDERLELLEKWMGNIETVIRDRIMMFSQDIIATMKHMNGNLRDECLWRILHQKSIAETDSGHDLHVQEESVVEVPVVATAMVEPLEPDDLVQRLLPPHLLEQ